MTDRELMQMALDALEEAQDYTSCPTFSPSMTQQCAIAAVAIRARLEQNDFNPDWDAMAVMVEEQQRMAKRIEELEARLAQPEPEPVAHSVIAGALFDFMGWLTSRKERIVLSSADNASPAVEVITEFAKMRGLSLDDAKVQDWNTAPPQREWQGLTDEERTFLAWESNNGPECVAMTEAKLKEKNT
jgi:hypothetical protein